MADKFRFKGSEAANWTSYNPILASREPGIETDTLKMKVGNGVDLWTDLPYINGEVPEHEWLDGELRFRVPGGEWGSYENLVGPKGDAGERGDAGTLSTGSPFYTGPQVINTDITIGTADDNHMTIGPITIADGVTVTVDGGRWVII